MVIVRPAGVLERFREVRQAEWDVVYSRPGNAFRARLMSFINLSGRLRFYDLAERTVLTEFREAYALVEDSSQRRTGTAFERRSIELHQVLADKPGPLGQSDFPLRPTW